MADQAAEVLLDAKVPFYQRGNRLVRPVVLPVQSFGGKSTMAAQLVEVELPLSARHAVPEVALDEIRQALEEVAGPAHPPAEAAQVLLKRFGDWTFPATRRDHHHADAAPRRHHPEGCGLRSGDAAAADRSAADAGDLGEADAG